MITEAPGCHEEYSTVHKVVESGERVRPTERQALHVIGEHAEDPDPEWQAEERYVAVFRGPTPADQSAECSTAGIRLKRNRVPTASREHAGAERRQRR